MFARFLELTAKPEKKPELIKAIKDEIIPVLKTYKGFVDVIHLEVETDPTKLYGITLWRDKADLEKYTRQGFPKIQPILERYVAVPIVARQCTVHEAISMKFVTAAAA